VKDSVMKGGMLEVVMLGSAVARRRGKDPDRHGQGW